MPKGSNKQDNSKKQVRKKISQKGGNNVTQNLQENESKSTLIGGVFKWLFGHSQNTENTGLPNVQDPAVSPPLPIAPPTTPIAKPIIENSQQPKQGQEGSFLSKLTSVFNKDQVKTTEQTTEQALPINEPKIGGSKKKTANTKSDKKNTQQKNQNKNQKQKQRK